MGTLFIFIGGFIGVTSAAKKMFLQAWIFLVNLCLSAYLGLFLATMVLPMLEIPGIDSGYKNVLAVFGLMLISFLILYKLSETVFPNREIPLVLPALAERIGTFVSGFLAGMVVATLVIYCYCQCPFSALVSSPSRESLKVSAGNSMLRMIRIVNVFSFQFISTEGEKDLQKLGVIPAPKTPPKADQKNMKNKKKSAQDTAAKPKSKETTEASAVKESPAPAQKKRPWKNKITRLED